MRVLTPAIKVVNKLVKRKKDLRLERVRESILDTVPCEVLELTTKQGVHPGDIAFTFDEHNYATLMSFYIRYLMSCRLPSLSPQNPVKT